jgi:pantoate--beta-alanine ligase
MQDTAGTLFQRGRSLGLVPTMGALHEGHMNLVRLSRMENDVTVVSIFVNPTQFGPSEDLARYPRDLDGDSLKLRAAEVDILFLPDADAMYPRGDATAIDVGEIGGKLCGAFRPGHFNGVAQVVVKLLNIVFPTRAYFGLKDYQQFLVVKRTASDLNMPVEIVPCPTVREEDGLAMSSRNQYLSPEERRAGPTLFRCLRRAEDMLRSEGCAPGNVVHFLRDSLVSEPLVNETQYAGVYDPQTLEPLKEFRGTGLIAAAIRIGGTRLIDNIVL